MRSPAPSQRSSHAMIGIDSNILVRLIVADEPKQVAIARDFIRDHCTPDDPGYISIVVLAEVVWILGRGYQYSRVEIADTIERVMETAQLQVESSTDVALALADYRRGPAGFTDCLIGYVNRTAECTHTVTFDRKAAKLSGFKLLTAS
jgi:predicted nucleic-acid-binding protein